MKNTKITFLFLLVLVLLGFKVKAAPIIATTFNQVSGSGWGTAVNWSGGVRPSGTDNVEISANCIMNLTGACNDLTVNSGDTLFLVSGSNLTVNGTITMNGYIKVTGGTLTLTKNFLTIPGITYNKLVIGNSKSMLAGGPITINNDLVIGNSSILDDNDEVIQVKGNILNNGTHQSGGSNGKIVLNGSATQTINSTFLNPFNAHCHFGNLELDNASGARVGTSGSTNVVVEITGTLSLAQGNLNMNSFTLLVGDPSTSTGKFNNAGNGIISGSNSGWIVFMGDASADAVTNLRVNTNGNVYIDLPKGVKLGAGSTIGSQLSLVHGTLDQNGFDLNIGKSTASTGAILFQNNGALKNTGSTGTLSLSGSAGTNPFSNIKVDTLAGLTINTPGGASLFGNLYVKNRLSVVKGSLNMNNHTIVIAPNGSLSEAPGQLVAGLGQITYSKNYTSALSNINMGGLGLVLSTTTAPGSIFLSRFNDVWNSGGNVSIKRTFGLSSGSPFNITKIEFNYDSTELNGLNRSNLVITSSSNSGSTWSSLSSCVASTGSFPTGKITRTSNYSYSGAEFFTACDASLPLSPVFNNNLAQEVAPSNALSVYPNPAENNFNISMDAKEGRYMFVLTDISGRVLKSTQMETTSGVNTFNFDISEYPTGIYIMNISNGTDVRNVKIQKQ